MEYISTDESEKFDIKHGALTESPVRGSTARYVKRLVSKESGEQEQLVSSIQSTSQSQKPETSVIDADNVLMTPTCANTEQTSNRLPMLPPSVSTDAVPTWVLMLPPDMAAMATVAWFYGSIPQLDVAA
jgi:hypothetical protein